MKTSFSFLGQFRRKNVSGRPKRFNLFIRFSILSFIIFVLLGFLVITTIAPVFEQHAIEEQKAETVVFSNRLVNRILTPEDFTLPVSQDSMPRFRDFVGSLQIQAPITMLLVAPGGRVLYSEPEEYVGADFGKTNDIVRALEGLVATARFERVPLAEQETLGAKEIFLQVIPLTFGDSPKAAGVLYTISRTGFVRRSIAESQKMLVARIVAGLSVLYVSLAFIVLGASKTIQRQGNELEAYATELEQRVVARTKQLEEAHTRELALKGQFVSIATHQLRTPITVITWALDLIKNTEHQKLPEKMEKALASIESSNKVLHSQLNNFLMLTLLEAGKLRVNLETFDVIPLLRDVIEVGRAYTALKAPTVSIQDVLPRGPVMVQSDPKLLPEIVTNLVTNAVKYNRKNGEVVLSVTVEDMRAVISVKDTGIGINQEDQSHVFEQFWRSEKVAHAEGTGLGLSIVKKFSEHIGGKIWFTSTPGEGTTFFVSVPRANAENQGPGKIQPA